MGHQQNKGHEGILSDEVRKLLWLGVFDDAFHVPRVTNTLADCLASFSFTLLAPCVWVEEEIPTTFAFM